MSHVTKLSIEIMDLEALAEGCKDLGIALRMNQKTFKYYAGQKESCDAAIVDPNNADAYEIGVRKQADHYSLHWDDFAGGKGMVEKVGRNASKLNDYYSAALAENHWLAKGYRVEKTVENDRIFLTARK